MSYAQLQQLAALLPAMSQKSVRQYVPKKKSFVQGRKKTFKKKTKVATGLVIPRFQSTLSGVGMPRRLLMKMPYIDPQSLWTTTGLAVPYTTVSYYVNSPGQLNASSSLGANYPANFKEIGSIYSNHRVHAVSFYIEQSHNLASPVESTMGFTFNPGDGSASTNFEIAEQPFSNKRLMLASGSGGERATYKGFVKLSAVYGKKNEYTTNPATQGSTTVSGTATAPTQLCTMWLNWNTCSAGNLSAIYNVVRLTLWIEWFNPHILTS